MTITQSGASPPLYMVVMCKITVCEVFGSYEVLTSYYNENCRSLQASDGDVDEDLQFELDSRRVRPY